MPKRPPENQIVKSPQALSRYFSHLEAEQRAALEELFQAALQEAATLEVYDLWEGREFAVTYWILLLSGVNQEEEKALANELLFWKAFLAKYSARVICIQSSDRQEFRCCSASFGVVNCPTLIFSDHPDMEKFVKIDAQLLFKLAEQRGALQRFFTRIHSLIENGQTISDVQVMLDNEKFWSSLKLVYKEAKTLISFSKEL